MLCVRCLEYKLPMDMHSLTLCKNCWAKDYTKKYEDDTIKTWITRREKK